MNNPQVGIQAYYEVVEEAWRRYCEKRREAAIFTDCAVCQLKDLGDLKKQTVESVMGDEQTIPPRAVAFVGLRKPEVFVPGVIVTESNGLFERELKRQILGLTNYKLNEFRLKYADSGISEDYFMLTKGRFRKDAMSDGEKKELSDFAEDCVDLALLFSDKEFRKVCEEFSQFPGKLAERYVSDLQLRGGKR